MGLRDAALRAAQQNAGAAPAPTVGRDLTAPQVPMQPLPDPEGAESTFFEKAYENFALHDPGPVAAGRAMEATSNIRARPADIPADPTLFESAQQAFRPHQMTGDQRSIPEVAKSVLGGQGRAVIGLLDPFGLNPIANQGRSLLTPDHEKGLPTENSILWAMRVLGTAVPAVIQETVTRTPTPDVARAVQAESWADAAAKFFTPSTVGEQLMGVEPGSLQRVRRGTGADWAEGVLERIEDGRGLEEDFREAAKNKLGPEWENTAWWVGFGVDALTDWEGSLAKVGRLPAKLAATTAELRKLDPSLSIPASAWTALRGAEVDMGEWLGSKLARHLEDGGSIDDLPAAIRARAEEVALRKHEQGLAELAEAEGIGAARAPQATDRALEEGLQEAERAAAEARPGETPGVFSERRAVASDPAAATAAAKRPPLPEFGSGLDGTVSSARQFWEKARSLYQRGDYPTGGYNLRRGEGFKRFVDWKDQTPDRANYMLRSLRGDVVRQGTFDDVVNAMLKRQLDGDAVWWTGPVKAGDDAAVEGKRVAARWGKTQRPGESAVALASDYLFSSDIERAIVQDLRKTDPRAIPPRLRGIQDAAKRKAATDVAGRVMADALTDAPPGAVNRTPIHDVIEEATRLATRDIMGSERLKMLPTGAMVAKADHRRILEGTDRAVGMKVNRAAQLIQGALPTEAEARHLAELGRRYDVALDPAALTSRNWMELRRAAMRQVGGVLADARYRVQGTAGYANQLLAALSDAHLDRRKYSKVGEAVLKRGPMKFIAEALLENKIGGLPPGVRTAWKELRTRLERNSDDLLLQFRALKDEPTAAGKLIKIVGQYTAVHPAELELAGRTANEAQALLAKTWKGRRPRWLTSDDPLIVADGFRAWKRSIEDAGGDAGRRWLLSHMMAAGRDVSKDLVRESIEKLPNEVAIKVYREAFIEGKLDGPALREAMEAAGIPASMKLDPQHALVIHAVHSRAQHLVAEAMNEMQGLGMVGLGSDARRPALQAVAFGEHRTWNDVAKRWDYRFPEAQVTYALNQLRDWGIDPGSGATIERAQAGKSKVLIPKYLADELQRMVASAQVDSRGIYANDTLNNLMRAFKEWTTHGILIPNPTYFTGQLLSLAPALMTTQGLRGATSTAGAFIHHPMLVGGLLKRLSKGGTPTFEARVPGQAVLKTAAGEVFSLDELEAAARRAGLQDTPTSFETSERLRDVLMADGAEYRILDPRRIVRGAREWQRIIQQAAGSFDLAARMGVFVRDVERGLPLEQAAENARKATLDFRDLTRWEATYMRKVFTFYAFLRKNADAYMRAMIEHPGAVTAQMRLAHGAMQRTGLTPIEQGAISDDDIGRMTLYDDHEVVNDQGRIHPFYRMNRLQSTPLGVGELLGTMRMFTGADNEKLLQNVTPLAQALGILTMGRRLDREFDSPHSNRIPPVLLDSPLSPLLMDLFGVGPVAIRANEDPLVADDDATAELGSGEPAVWAAGGNRMLTPEQADRYRKAWQLFSLTFGRPISTLQQGAEAAGLEPPPPNITQDEASLAFLLGLRYRPVLNEGEVVRRGLEARERTFREATKDIAVPDRYLPR